MLSFSAQNEEVWSAWLSVMVWPCWECGICCLFEMVGHFAGGRGFLLIRTLGDSLLPVGRFSSDLASPG